MKHGWSAPIACEPIWTSDTVGRDDFFDRPLDVGHIIIRHARPQWQRDKAFIGLLGDRPAALLVSKRTIVGMPRNRNIVNVHSNVLGSQGTKDCVAADGET